MAHHQLNIFDRSTKLPFLIVSIGVILIAIFLLIHAVFVEGTLTLNALVNIQVNNGYLQVLEFSFLFLFLISWLISIPLANKYNHIKNILKNQTETIESMSRYAENIGEGKYHDDPTIQLNGDLGMIMTKMREQLKETTEKDRNGRWISEGRELIGSVLRDNQDLNTLTYKVLETIVDYTNVIQGAIYTANIENKGVILKMEACYAYNRRKYLEKSFRAGEGLVGQVAIERAYIHRTEIPDSYVTIKSGILGERKPNALLLIPLIVEEQLEGVIELASFREFSELEITFLEDLSVMIARTIFNLKTKEQTEKLLRESTAMTKELQSQQLQLQEHAEEMVKKQQLIEETNIKLQEKIQEVQNSHIRQHALLENASEIITIFDKQMNILYESPSVKNILGFDPEEIMEKSILDKLDADSRISFRRMFSALIKNPDKEISIEFRYKKNNGERVWMQGSGRNMLADPAINGIIFNHRDITQRKLAEQEQIMRGKMQALSENSQDMIIRFDKAGFSLYVNPMIEKFTGLSQNQFSGKPYQHLNIDFTIKEAWDLILDEVKNTNEICEREFEVQVIDELRSISVTAIPEFDEHSILDSVLVVSHDITERKRSEQLVHESNRKITESINYAKRIQNSIIPAYNEIQKSVQDAFIWYQPKDVVSGDFPWIYQNGDDVYIAAVDCTGHGVPGAMMSLIGYLLLNDITKEEGISAAGVLDNLHRGVVNTLKQNVEGNNASDGMDIALVRYNNKGNVLEFAGAHRPLYHLSGEELIQIKGDKMPIGGNQYDLNSFTNHIIDIKPNDTIYIFSDGLPDQFGGPDKLKYGPRRIREQIHAHRELSMKEQGELFNNNLKDWMKDDKQIDDILIIGLKF